MALRSDLKEEEQRILDQELQRMKTGGVLMWKRGEIENYLPQGVRTVGEVIELLANDAWLHRVDAIIRTELVEVACWILQLDEKATESVKTRLASPEEGDLASA